MFGMNNSVGGSDETAEFMPWLLGVDMGTHVVRGVEENVWTGVS